MPYSDLPHQRTSEAARTLRAARNGEDARQMTAAASMTRLAVYVAQVLKRDPELDAREAGRRGAQLLSADMRRARQGQPAAALRGDPGPPEAA